ncbi:MAG: cell envelope integrity EipB family protein [Phyllobacteriaceae bacterium]|nr:cell envelope integrity EipB family protein [Phyllobacteriaceae bacterium]
MLLPFALCSALATPAFAAPSFAPHRAVYDVKLDRAEERSGISGMEGRLVFQFEGSACDGYTMNMRFVLRMQLPEDVRVTDQQTTTFESGDGSEFNFVTKTFTDQKLDKELRGAAIRDADSIDVTVEKPDEVDVTLETSQFPTMHLAELVKKAKAGETFYETTLFDGTDDGDRLLVTSVVIGKLTEPKPDDLELAKADAIKALPYWPVTIAYFDPLEETGGEAEPQYRIGFKLHENGITRDLTMDYGDFALTGRLAELKMLEVGAPCAE